jgi:hypothetical protein
MKEHTKRLTTALAVASGLIIAGSAQAQYVSGDQYLDNIYIGGGYGPLQPFSTTGPTGISITTGADSGYLYGEADIPVGEQQHFSPGDNQVVYTYTINSPAPGTTGLDYGSSPAWSWYGIQILLAANGGSDERYGSYDGYNLTYSPINGQNIGNEDPGYVFNPANNTVTETCPLDATTLAGIESGTITAVQFSIDPVTMPDGYSVTFNSIELVPEPGIFGLLALGSLLFSSRRSN